MKIAGGPACRIKYHLNHSDNTIASVQEGPDKLLVERTKELFVRQVNGDPILNSFICRDSNVWENHCETPQRSKSDFSALY
ncbi:hypothetical protein NPIL_664721 [Nephila pilipes]|uniref:Uncharacterized protein n=1 Tax=Nephila pilipes TaxID=299642 RepID=A0A8X6Q018_NEPPI|nr:hypothetical protein NPIL_664721 [Nephila pilipes]